MKFFLLLLSTAILSVFPFASYAQMAATGGVVTIDGPYKVHTFSTVGTDTFRVLGGSANVRYLVVAGGGAGLSGGGGAGGMKDNGDYLYNVSKGSYTVTVGAGGINTTSPQGKNSVFDTITAHGGGAGGGNPGADGGAGGASGGHANTLTGWLTTPYPAGKGISGEGHNGGVGRVGSSVYARYGGGGGGAGTAGHDGTFGVVDPGKGGDGKISDITGDTVYYAGGGAASNSNNSGKFYFTGGIGGGGGTSPIDSVVNINGTDGLGGGGASGGNGGSGVVIIRYLYGDMADAGKDTAICIGNSVTLTAKGGKSYIWQTGNAADTLSTLTVTPLTTTTYTVSAWSGTYTTTDAVTVFVDTIPTAVISGAASLCKTGSTTLTASGGSTGYLWSTGETTSTITVDPIADSIYSVTVKNGGCSDTSSATVARFIANSITGTSAICIGDIGSLTLSVNGATSFLWNNGDTTGTISIAPSVDSLYQVIVSNGTCSDTASVAVTVVSPPVASITGTASVCQGESISLQSTGGTSYLWNTSDTSATLVTIPQADTTYIVTAFLATCSDTESVQVTVKPSPVITTTDVSITSGTSATITASSTENNTYTWNSSTDLSCTSCQSPVASPAGSSTYYVIATGANGCTSADSVIVTVLEPQCEVFVPNAFSPNGDGQNDLLKVHGDCVTELNLVIYDRWGEKVFEATDINTGWDGTYKGKQLNSTVFMYYMNYSTSNNTTLKEQNGNISLIR